MLPIPPALRRLTRRPEPAGAHAALDDLPLERRERLLSSAATVGGGWAVATDRALLVGPSPWRRLPWWRITSVSWQDEELRLVVTVLADSGPDGLALDLVGQSLLPETVHERVRSTIVVSRHVRLRGTAGVRLVGRRRAGEDELAWQAVLDEGLDPRDTDLVAAAERALEELRRDTLP